MTIKFDSIKYPILFLLAFSALVFSFYSYEQIKSSKETSTELGAINDLIKVRDSLLNELQGEPFVEPNLGILPSYLAKIRRDGVPKHADMKQRLNALAENTTAFMTLVDLYEPQAKTPEFKAEAKKVMAYAIAWTDRWNSVMDLFMSGGGYPATEVPFPDQFAHAVQLEIAASK